ncbi:glycosyl hydrolase family 88 [Paenibacillus mucilaginosus 3016]|uniref:Glycosyl hydrolase family 88 n=1 Tax=Paenibacillus mucilaginosus 3016 TaxID=1116391 RepID=H6NCM1_9BACL|nr:glycoside hydrolase family 88 protein [Paenibacillus mucilaginosus]AFC28950.1 glycosyl hydrolase family 88 [Paenibacillus mucilaginosus 3016]WFA17700.1 glucuronyl hydrolase [Paenibacillus mucilaginosus]
MSEIHDEGIKNRGKFEHPPAVRKHFCEEAIAYVLHKIDQNLGTFTHKFPEPASVNLVYAAMDNVEWTSSFWTGMLWLAYEITGDVKYRSVAEIQLESYKKRVDEKIATGTHDLGFLYTLSSVAAYKLTKSEAAKEIAVKAADLLMGQYFEKAGIIQAWGGLDDPENGGRMIIDCCMNLPLLYWASEVTGDPKYCQAAYSHVKQAEKYIIREDASSYHTYFMDIYTGAPKYGRTVQGYSDRSCWSRGQAWGIYGFPLSYKYTGDYGLIVLAKKVANYFINRLPDDSIAYWDLIFTSGPEERDSSSSAIAACGLLELSKYLPPTDDNRRLYENAAMHMIHSLASNYTTADHPESNGILLHAVYAKPHNKGIDECNIWGDYFYFEALVRLVKNWELYW